MSADEFGGIGFAPGVVTGVRSFEVDKLGRLTGISYKQVWAPGENKAECRAVADPYALAIQRVIAGGSIYGSNYLIPATKRSFLGYVTGSAPAPVPVIEEPEATDYSKPHDMAGCHHGFYAYYDGSNDYHDKGRVSAVIEGYGEVVIGTRGFRAMKARIVALRINKNVSEHLQLLVRRNYRAVPFFDSFKTMVAEFPPDHGGAGVTPESDPNFWTRKLS